MIPNVGVVTERCRAALGRIDAVALGARRRLIAVASLSRKPDAGRARALVRSLIERLEWSLSNSSGDDIPPERTLELLRDVLRRSWSNSDASDYIDGGLLVAYIGSTHLVTLVRPGVRCYRFRGGSLLELTSPTPSDSRPDGDEPLSVLDETAAVEAYVVCSEGLYGAVSEHQMLRALRDDYHPRRVAMMLVSQARPVALRADMTAIVIRPGL